MRKRSDGQKVFTHHEMIGRYDQFGRQIVRWIKRQIDSKGSQLQVYEFKDKNGKLELDAVHVSNHVPWWYRASLTDPQPHVCPKTWNTLVPRFYSAYAESLVDGREVFAEE